MTSERKLLIGELQARLVPFLVGHDFQQVALPERDRKSREISSMLPLGCMKRTRGDDLDLVELQIHPRRTAFVVAFDRAAPEGVSLPWATLSQPEVHVGDLSENCRLYARRSSMTWFGKSWWLSFGRNPAASIADAIDRAIKLYPEVEAYFRSGAVGPHVKCVRYSIDDTGKLKAAIRSA